jgi:ATP-dependent DNA helicase RecQ
VRSWLEEGVPAGQIAVLGRRWEGLELPQAVLEHGGIPTRSLRREDSSDRLLSRWLTCHLAEQLRRHAERIWPGHQSIRGAFEARFREWGRDPGEPTVRALLELAEELDRERRPDPDEEPLAVSNAQVLEALFEREDWVSVEASRVALGSCHSVKGLEFERVLLLADGALSREEHRRVGYVAMTRARRELVLACTRSSVLAREAGLTLEEAPLSPGEGVPGVVVALDATLSDVWLSFHGTRRLRETVHSLKEGDPLRLAPRASGENVGWGIYLPGRADCVGVLSRRCGERLRQRGIEPGRFEFRDGEVSVRAVVRHAEQNEETGEWVEKFVVLPRIRVWR